MCGSARRTCWCPPFFESSHLVSQLGLNIGCQRHAGHTCCLAGSSSAHWGGLALDWAEFHLLQLHWLHWHHLPVSSVHSRPSCPFPDSWSFTFVSACAKSRSSSGPVPQPARVSTVLSPLSSSGSVVCVRQRHSVGVCVPDTHTLLWKILRLHRHDFLCRCTLSISFVTYRKQSRRHGSFDKVFSFFLFLFLHFYA